MTPIETIQEVDKLLLAAKLPVYSDLLQNVSYYKEEKQKVQTALAPFKQVIEVLQEIL